MADSSFFESMTPQSEVKVRIVTKYFDAWSTIMITKGRHHQVGYADLFSGPGNYKDGEDSTPLRILKKAVEEPRLGSRLLTLFNDVRPQFAAQLQTAIDQIDGIESLRFRPQVLNLSVGSELIKNLSRFSSFPTLYFIDPWGYKGITADLLRHAVYGRGSECILFFNFNRINSAISNPTVQHHMRQFFGEEDYESLLKEVLTLDNSKAREERIVQALTALLADAGAKHHILFRFEQVKKERTSHYIVFASKHPLGVNIMKGIMARESMGPDGISLFEWKPQRSPQLSLELGMRRMEVDQEIRQLMLRSYSFMEATVKEIYAALSSGTTFTLADFQRVLNSMEDSGEVSIDKPRDKRFVGGKLTLGENRRVRFLK